MNDKRYQWILYLIVFVIIGTIGIQVYWNYKNYQVNKQQLINDVQVSLDNAVDSYYADLAHASTIALTLDAPDLEGQSLFATHFMDSIFLNRSDSLRHRYNFPDSLRTAAIFDERGIFTFRGAIDSVMSSLEVDLDLDSVRSSRIRQIQLIQSDSSTLDNFRNLTSKVLISMTQDSLNIKTIDSLVQQELKRKNIYINYDLEFKPFNRIHNFFNPTLLQEKQPQEESVAYGAWLSTTSTSAFLPRDGILKINFNNTTRAVLKRILSGILISTLLVLAVISSLFYLLRIIKHQKQLAEVKNDLISNITHEFKTPIATIGVALESIKDFNVLDDKEKTKNYLNMSKDQLSKLNVMVEKLLETATLDSDNLDLNKEHINLTELLEIITNKHNLYIQGKNLSFETSDDSIMINVDVFHFENAVNNIIDNAIKYGGDMISVKLTKTHIATEIAITDNGNTLKNNNKERIFEKFYRIPKGNTHDVKGFGIGLYYAKKIVEKHNGIITLDLNHNSTIFKIVLPNE